MKKSIFTILTMLIISFGYGQVDTSKFGIGTIDTSYSLTISDPPFKDTIQMTYMYTTTKSTVVHRDHGYIVRERYRYRIKSEMLYIELLGRNKNPLGKNIIVFDIKEENWHWNFKL